MINNDTLIKILRSRGHKTDWPEAVNSLNKRINDIKLGFPGIRNDHLSLVEYKDLREDDIYIVDDYFLGVDSDNAPVMLRKIPMSGNNIIEGIGIGEDSIRDPKRTNMRWKDIIQNPEFPEDMLVLRVDCRPTENGGPGYYYFFKSYRDFRI